ncbi:hypothetical protein [Marinicella sp. W31]|uniref:hypothetical protein n=1 Tax=Marinicella sp. W31 TaxID=3023713 RepID=UPI0037566508
MKKLAISLIILLLMYSNVSESSGCMHLFESGDRHVGICNSIHPKGHEERTKRASELFKNIGIPDINSPSGISIYVEWFPAQGESAAGFFYFSNYKGKDFEYTRKAVFQISDLRRVVDTILDENKITDKDYKKIKLYVHPNIIASKQPLGIGILEKFYIRFSEKEVIEVREKNRERCKISYEDPCKDKRSDPEKYHECRNKIREISFGSIVEGIINGLTSSLECTLSPS